MMATPEKSTAKAKKAAAPKKAPAAKSEAKSEKKTGPIEGLKLLLSKPYLMGILGIATLYEIIGTILDYQMKFLADEAYGSAEKVAEFLNILEELEDTQNVFSNI